MTTRSPSGDGGTYLLGMNLEMPSRQAAASRAAEAEATRSPRTLVVIVSYKATDLTIAALASLAPEIEGVSGGIGVEVCENGTGPDDVRRLEATVVEHGWSGWARVRSVYPNLGFTGGNNAVIRPALSSANPPDLIFLLNSDTIVRPGAIRAIVEFMDRSPGVGIAGSGLEDLDGNRRSTSFRFFTPLTEFEASAGLGLITRLVGRQARTGPLPSEPVRTDWTSGAALMVRREVFEQIGLLDEGLYTYFDDIDLCMRAARAGWETWSVPESRIVHLMGQTTGVGRKDQAPKRLPEYFLEARRYFWLKAYGPVRTALADLGRLTGMCLAALRNRLQGRVSRRPPHELRDALRHSVFAKGFRLVPVRNPALEEARDDRS
jgi:GT2 family glycosyltransferase